MLQEATTYAERAGRYFAIFEKMKAYYNSNPQKFTAEVGRQIGRLEGKADILKEIALELSNNYAEVNRSFNAGYAKALRVWNV